MFFPAQLLRLPSQTPVVIESSSHQRDPQMLLFNRHIVLTSPSEGQAVDCVAGSEELASRFLGCIAEIVMVLEA